MTRSHPMASDLCGPALEREVHDAREAVARLARSVDDDEGIHDLRVAVRRMRTFLRASRGLYRRGETRRIERALRAVGQATNPLRDEEVLAETLEGIELTPTVRPRIEAWLRARRAALVARRRDALEQLRAARLEETLAAVAALVAEPRRDVEAARFAEERLDAERVDLVRLVARVRAEDVEPLHELRILFKRMRYLSDMLGGPAGEGRARLPHADAHLDAAAVAATFQKELGLVHDLDVARTVVSAAPELHHATRASVERALVRRRLTLATDCLERLRLELGQLLIPRRR
jgi:CHAD domain-containing protein